MAVNGNGNGSSRKIIILIAFIILVILAFFLIRNYIAVILAAAVLAYILHWPYNKFKKLIKNDNLAAAIIVIIVVIALAVFFYFVAQNAIKEAFNLYLSIQKLDTYQVINNFIGKIFGNPQLSNQISLAVQRAVTTVTNQFITMTGDIATKIPELVFQFFILLFLTFYFLKDGGKIVSSIRKVLPFDSKTNEKFIDRSKNIVAGTIWGMIIIGIIQGIVAGIGFYLFHAPSPLFFTLIAIFLAILPFIGPWLVWAPVGLAMIAGGHLVNGLLLMIFGLLVVGTIDNIVRPLVVGKYGKINPAIALIGMLGGLALIGPIGLIVGPIILEYLIMLIDAYRESKEKKK